MQMFDQLKPDYTVESAKDPMQELFTQIRKYKTTLPAAKNWSAYSRKRFIKKQLHVITTAMSYSEMRNDFSTALIVLICMIDLVLLITYANIANLLIARGFIRQKEMTIRLSLGASHGRLVGQLLTESLVLSFAEKLANLDLAILLTKNLLALVPSDKQPILISAHPDPRILAFTLCLTFVTDIIFDLVPALHANRPNPWTTLKNTMESIASTSDSVFLRKELVTTQVTLNFMLLFVTDLFVKNLQNLKTTNTDVTANNLITFQLAPALNGYDNSRAVLFYRELLNRLHTAPDMKSATLTTVPILSGNEWNSSMSVKDHTPDNDEDMQAYINALSPNYFETMKIPFIEERDFTAINIKKHSTMAIVNRRFAEHFFPERNAISKHIEQDTDPKSKLTTEIIGIVADSLYEEPREGVHRQIFVPN